MLKHLNQMKYCVKGLAMEFEQFKDTYEMIVEKYQYYKQNMADIIEKTKAKIVREVYSKGELANKTPLHVECLGYKLKKKILDGPIKAYDCLRYSYDEQDRIIMIEEWTSFGRFSIKDIFIYGKETENIRCSDESIGSLFFFDHPWGNSEYCFSWNAWSQFCVQEYKYENGVLKRINRLWNDIKMQESHQEYLDCIYENNKLIQIVRVCDNGYTDLQYSTRKPDFNNIKTEFYEKLKSSIEKHKNYSVIGLECFLDDKNPMCALFYTDKKEPDELIADWKTEPECIQLYDYYFNNSQERKMARVIAEAVVELVKTGELDGIQIYLHQDTVCFADVYPSVGKYLKKENINVK